MAATISSTPHAVLCNVTLPPTHQWWSSSSLEPGLAHVSLITDNIHELTGNVRKRHPVSGQVSQSIFSQNPASLLREAQITQRATQTGSLSSWQSQTRPVLSHSIPSGNSKEFRLPTAGVTLGYFSLLSLRPQTVWSQDKPDPLYPVWISDLRIPGAS